MFYRVAIAGALVVGAGLGAGCGASKTPIEPDAMKSPVGFVDESPQRPGDPEAGYTALVNNGYVSCGIPYSLYEQFLGGGGGTLIPGRTGRNASLSYEWTAFTTDSGVEIVSTNCLICHAGRINGQLVIGLGAADVDFTDDQAGLAELAGNFITDEAERVEWRKWADRVVAIGPYTRVKTIGVNPADNLAAVLFAHRDPETLAWSNEPILELPPSDIVVPVDVPPWWRMQKKHAMFYDGAGRGDHARIMMSASALCTDTVAEAEEIDAYFPDIRAYLMTLVPPAWPFPVDAQLAAQGQIVYEGAGGCAGCHGTNGPGSEYPNFIVAVGEVGTDPVLALGAAQFADPYVNWFNESFYGKIARLAPAPGYYAPPLDGIWSTAPFLHNGSVPTMAALLDSGTRPRYWTRTFDSSDYDQAAIGWNYTELDHGQDAEPTNAVRKTIYDTTLLGYSNSGHIYGDALSAADRAALLEYLKTI